jgi:hypothetical protein
MSSPHDHLATTRAKLDEVGERVANATSALEALRDLLNTDGMDGDVVNARYAIRTELVAALRELEALQRAEAALVDALRGRADAALVKNLGGNTEETPNARTS